jgi:hypothetical protein
MDWVDWKMIHLVFCILAMRLNDHLGDNVLVFRNREREERRERESKRETERERDPWEAFAETTRELPNLYSSPGKTEDRVYLHLRTKDGNRGWGPSWGEPSALELPNHSIVCQELLAYQYRQSQQRL